MTMTLEQYENIGVIESVAGKIKVGGNEYDKKDSYKSSYWNQQTKRYRVFSRSKFTKHFTGEGHDIADTIDNDAELGKMYRIMKNIDDDNMIMYNNHDKKKTFPADRELMLKMIGLSGDRSARFLSKMIKLDIIHEVKFTKDSTRYYINPIYTMSSTGISLNLYKIFREQLVSVLPKQAVSDLDTLLYYEQNPAQLADLYEKRNNEDNEEMEQFFDRMQDCIKVEEPTEEERAESLKRLQILMLWANMDGFKLTDKAQSKPITEDVFEDISKSFRDYIEHNDRKRLVKELNGLIA